ncbi:carboxymuconolactone decarboxylase family protein [Sporosarcina ureilytica]|uniref:Carboxymuconolactone decarboxylase-like domain-containing protein n=1 Tax=Sporosarcina ureilytica TaxID=298596 RepID=A0A1D8JFJ6_9BACL|nr:hypothetical protein [Sporosarcina ureilytica]AOV07484.1 hypothetical protein BI350_08005 [Sporosarcina ureilytica]
MTRLPYVDHDAPTPLQKIVSETPEILSAYLQMEKALGNVLKPNILELTRLRVAANNDCKFCKSIELNKLDANKRNVALRKEQSIDLTLKEEAALQLVDEVMAYHGILTDQLFSKVKEHFSAKEIIALLFQIGQKNSGGWFNIAMDVAEQNN